MTGTPLTLDDRDRICADLGHPGCTYNSRLDRTWCACGQATYPGYCVDWELTRNGGPLASWGWPGDATRDQAIAAAARAYVRVRDLHHNDGPRLSSLRAAHDALVDTVHADLIDLPDQTCTACGLEHPGALCGQPTLLEVRP